MYWCINWTRYSGDNEDMITVEGQLKIAVVFPVDKVLWYTRRLWKLSEVG